jgi:Pyrimidine reductase, riboflavin biosynthesis
MNRPYIVCHMLTSLDGKIIGRYLKNMGTMGEEYEKIHKRYSATAWLCGRVTMEKDFTENHRLGLPKDITHSIPRTDHVADQQAKTFAVAVDAHGKLGWTTSTIGAADGDHIVEVLAESAPDAYLAHLRETGISYLFGGKETLDFTLVAEKLKNLFGIEKLLLEGGGYINGSFLREDLVDEYSWLVVPVAEGASGLLTAFETMPGSTPGNPLDFSLEEAQKLENGGLWLRYTRKR